MTEPDAGPTGTPPSTDPTVLTRDLAGLFALPPDSTETTSVSRIGRFLVHQLIGRGGAGLVYLAFEPNLQRRVAIKVLRDSVRGRIQLEVEAQLLALLEHPAIARVYALEELEDGTMIMVSEYIHGETLAGRLARGPLAIHEVLRIGEEIAVAIEFAHQRGVVHCDIKPANVMIAENRGIKVLDFGLARLLTAQERSARGGTPGYISPEQLKDGTLGPPTDVFSLCCLLFECLCGKLPFDPGPSFGPSLSPSFSPSFGRIDWALLPTGLPASVRTALEKGLELDFRERQISATELRSTLERARTAPTPARKPVTNNLPVHFTRFIGRHEELRAVSALLETSRLVALIGPGGCGKTRLAAKVAAEACDRFEGGVSYVELESCVEGRHVVAAVADALGLHEQPDRSRIESLTSRLRGAPTLLVLDNCEHLLQPTSDLVTDLLGACPALHVLVTSREALNVLGESVYRVPSLSRSRGRAGWSEAAQLFIDRARLVRPELAPEKVADAIDAICSTLDGLPLSIELAAARLRHSTVQQLAVAVADRLHTLTDGNRSAPPRHQTLRALIDWSYRLLSDAERTLLRRLSVFSAGWTLPAAESVCGPGATEGGETVAELTVQLINKSLVTFEEREGDPRFRILDTIRQYAAEQLERTESRGTIDELRARHARHFASVSRDANAGLTGPQQHRLIKTLRDEHENLRDALAWLAAADPVGRLELATTLAQYWYMAGFVNEGREQLADAYLRSALASPETRAQAANCLGILCWVQGRHRDAMRYYGESAELWKALGNTSRYAALLSNLAAASADAGEVERARATHEHAIETYGRLGDEVGVARAQLNLSVLLNQLSQHEQADRLVHACLPVLSREQDLHRVAAAIHNQGHARYGLGDHLAAAGCFADSLSRREGLDDRIGISLDRLWLAMCSARLDRPREAARQLALAEELRKRTGATLSRTDQAELDDTLRRLRAAITPEELDRILAEAAGTPDEQP